MATDIGPRIGLNGAAEYTRSLKNIIAQSKSLAAEMKAVTSSFDANDSSQKKLQAQMGVLTKQIETQQQRVKLLGDNYSASAKKVDDLNAELVKAIRDFGQTSTEAQKAAQALDRQEQATQRAKTEYLNATTALNKMQAEMGQLTSQARATNTVVGKIGDAAKSVADGTNQLADSVGDLASKAKYASAAVIGGGTYAAKTVFDLDGAVSKFISRTGESAAETENWKSVLEDLYKSNYGESFEDLADSAADVRTVLKKLDPKQIKNATKDAITLRDVFGYDIAESVRAAKALMDNFGVSADDAFNLIATGAQNGLDYSGELLDTISEYSVQFGKVGFSADDFFNILQNGADDSAYNLDKIGDAVKELSIRVVDGSDTTKEGFELAGLSADDMAEKFAAGGETARDAFYETIQALSKIEDPVEQNIAGVDLLGTMWEDLGANTVLAMGQATDAAYATRDAIGEIQTDRGEQLLSQFQELGKTAVDDIIIPLGEDLLPVMEDVLEVAKQIVGQFSNMSEEDREIVIALGGIVAVLPVILSAVSGILRVIGTISGAVSILTGATTTGTAAATGLATVFGVAAKVAGGISAIASGIAGAFSNLWGVIAANPLVAVLAAVAAAGIAVYKVIDDNAQQIRKGMEVVDSYLQNVFAVDFVNTMGPVIGGALNSFMASMENVWDTIQVHINNFLDFLRGVFSANWTQAWEAMKASFKSTFDSLVAIAKVPLNTILGFINGLIDRINTMISGLNGISIDVPEGVPFLGGTKFGFSIGRIPNVPMLAKGGIVRSGSAIVGEAGPELMTVLGNRTIVQPLSSHYAAASGGGGGGGAVVPNINITVYGAEGQDENALAEIVMQKIQAATARRGATWA